MGQIRKQRIQIRTFNLRLRRHPKKEERNRLSNKPMSNGSRLIRRSIFLGAQCHKPKYQAEKNVTQRKKMNRFVLQKMPRGGTNLFPLAKKVSSHNELKHQTCRHTYAGRQNYGSYQPHWCRRTQSWYRRQQDQSHLKKP